MAAVAVIAVGMVFVLGAFNQCLSSMTTAHKTIAATGLLCAKVWDDDVILRQENGSVEGAWEGAYEPPHEGFCWTQVTRAVSQDFGNETVFIEENLNEAILSVTWKQGKSAKDVSVTRFVKKKKE
jgi:hypothetical protein